MKTLTNFPIHKISQKYIQEINSQTVKWAGKYFFQNNSFDAESLDLCREQATEDI